MNMGLRAYISKRLIYSFLIICAVIIFNFFVFMHMGNPTELFLPPRAGLPEDVYEQYLEGLKKRWGLDQPFYVQLGRSLYNMLTFNFGISYRTRTDIPMEIAKRLPYTMLLVGTSTVASIIIGVLLGVVAAAKRGGKFDSFSVTSSLIFYSLPSFWIGMILLLIFATSLGWLPTGRSYPIRWRDIGFPVAGTSNVEITTTGLSMILTINPQGVLTLIWGYLYHLILPFATLTLFLYGGYLLLTRATMMDALTEDYVITARAKGVSESTVLYKHALKNASLPLITSAALSLAFMISGAIITETVFNYQGMGGWIWEAILFFDYGVLMPIFYVISLCVIVANLLADLLYGIIDPRIKYG